MKQTFNKNDLVNPQDIGFTSKMLPNTSIVYTIKKKGDDFGKNYYKSFEKNLMWNDSGDGLYYSGNIIVHLDYKRKTYELYTKQKDCINYQFFE